MLLLATSRCCASRRFRRDCGSDAPVRVAQPNDRTVPQRPAPRYGDRSRRCRRRDRSSSATVAAAGEQRFGGPAIRCLAAREQEADRSAETVAQGVELGGATTSRAGRSPVLRPPLTPAEQRCAFTWALSRSTATGGHPLAAIASRICRQMLRVVRRANGCTAFQEP